MFSEDIYKIRRHKLAEAVGSGILVFPGNGCSAINYDGNCYLFRQDSTFLYYFGVDWPNLAAIIDIDNDSHMIFGDEPCVDDLVWTGPEPTLAERSGLTGISRTAPISELSSYCRLALSSGRKVHLLPFYRGEQKLNTSQWLGVPTEKISEYISLDFIKAVAAQRNIKSAEEIEQIELAVDLTGNMQLAAMELTANGVFEFEVAAELAAVLTSYGSALSFQPIFSIRGEILHNPYYKNQMFDGDLALCDCGAESPLHYAGDITRTFPVSGTFTEQQKEIYSVVLNAQLDAIAAIKPGIEFREIHLLACEKLAHGLKYLGLMKGDIVEAVARGAHALFFPCGLGHMMGLDVHDMQALGEQYVGYGDMPRSTQFGLKSLRLAQRLQPGNVITVEPGIYFISDLIEKWRSENKFAEYICYDKLEEYYDFGGVRIEDDILITDDGGQVLGASIPKTIKEVEEACIAE